MFAIETFGLTKRFPKGGGWRRLLSDKPAQTVTAVDGVKLSVQRGELFGLIGPNGAGKTTLIKLLCTLIVPTSGTARVNGFDLNQAARIQSTISLVTGDERSFYWRLSGRQNLRFFGALYGLRDARLERRVEAALTQVELLDYADRQFQTYSTGMKQRLAIARGLLNDPQIIFMDEPTRSLDPTATTHLHTFIRDELVRRRGVTVFLATHRLREAEHLCDRLAIMDHGHIRACGSIAELRGLLGRGDRYRATVTGLTEMTRARLAALVGQVAVKLSQDGAIVVEFDLPPTDGLLSAAIDVLRADDAQIHAITSEPVPLEEVFEHLIRDSG
jgi:ABC-2 type transport system ATP-binding protein